VGANNAETAHAATQQGVESTQASIKTKE